jgi:hypothetical protein
MEMIYTVIMEFIAQNLFMLGTILLASLVVALVCAVYWNLQQEMEQWRQ